MMSLLAWQAALPAGPALPAAPAWLAGAAVREHGSRRGLLVSFKWDATTLAPSRFAAGHLLLVTL
jgi:hypothetical protein